MRRPAAIALLVVVVASVTAGCGFKPEPTRSIGPHFPVMVSDAAGRGVTLQDAPHTIVAMDPAGANLLEALGVKRVVYAPGASVAGLRRRHPDLVVMPPQTTPQRADVVERGLGVPTYVLAGFALSSIERGVAALGLATGHPLAGRNLAISLRARRLRLERQIAAAKRQTVFGDTGFGYSIAPDDLLATLVKDARGTLVGAGAHQPVSQKLLQKLDPDVYLTLTSSHVTLKILRKRELTAKLPAVLSGRVLIVDDVRIEPDLDAYRLLEQIAHFLHPETAPVIRAVLFDALGTLLRLEPPAPRLQGALAARLGLDVPLDRCETAMRAELRHYGANCIRAHDAATLAAVRLECAEVLADALAAGPSGPELLPCLMDAIGFTAFADSPPALRLLATSGFRIAVVSNWDVSLPPVLARLGLAEHVETVVYAAAVGCAKPDPAPFLVALARLALPADQCLHVGDDPVTDGEGARAAGIEPVLIDRAGAGGAGRRIGSLLELPELLACQGQAA